MFSNHKSTNRTLALFTFLAALILYLSTMAPTASFWDSGEFIAVAHGLEVTHPPGAPLYSILGRLFSMFMPANYVAVSINFISSLASALTIMLLYLIVVRLVQEWRGAADDMLAIDKIGMYGGAMIGALTFATTDTFWFNAVESEVYAISMFFTAMVVWLALVWAENHEEPNNERWLILIAYLFGLALGVHLLNLLALFFVALIIYFRKYEFTILSFCAAGALAVVSFLLIYPFTLQTLPTIMEDISYASYGLIGPIGFIAMVILVLGWGVYYTHKKHYRLANIIMLSYTMIMIGYSSYALIFIRSSADPPIDENDPETVQSFINYLERKQYGETPLLSGYDYSNEKGTIDRDQKVLFPRRYSTNPSHIQQYAQYSSDWDYFVNYQLKHMYIRYFNWNFIGRDSDIQDAGWQAGFTKSEHENNPAHNSYFYIPFLLGLFGMLFHFQKDWKRALSVMALFLLTGFAIIVFLNQTPQQPRERDYAYVGSFFAFAIWIGLGATGIIELIKDYLKSNKAIAYATLAILFLGSPILMGFQNYNDHDRSNRYVASDYAYNLLQSVAPNAIIFTNGDNDTFPLWYAQEVEGVRTDVRVVCLSLLNTSWYIKQLKNQWSHNSPPLPITLTDEQIDNIAPDLYRPDTVRIPVDHQMLQKAFSSEKEYKKLMGVNPDTSVSFNLDKIDFGIPIDSLDNQVDWYFQGRSAGQNRQGQKQYYTQIQDQVILNILKNNHWLRPVYFANTVSTQSQLNLQPYFRFEGKAFRVVPQRHNAQNYGWLNPEIHASRLRKFRFRDWSKPGVYLDENIRRMLGNYRFSITELSEKYMEMGKPDSANKWLKWGKKNLPFTVTDNDVRPIVLYAYNFAKAGNNEDALDLAKRVENNLLNSLKYNMADFDDIVTELTDLKQEMESARENADIERRQELSSKAQNIMDRRQNISRDISYSRLFLTIVQRIYYMAGKDGQADSLAKQVDQISGSRLSLPSSKEKNKEEVGKYGFFDQ